MSVYRLLWHEIIELELMEINISCCSDRMVRTVSFIHADLLIDPHSLPLGLSFHSSTWRFYICVLFWNLFKLFNHNSSVIYTWILDNVLQLAAYVSIIAVCSIRVYCSFFAESYRFLLLQWHQRSFKCNLISNLKAAIKPVWSSLHPVTKCKRLSLYVRPQPPPLCLSD